VYILILGQRRGARTEDETMMTAVMSYETAETLEGGASEELVRESEAAEPTGAVPAYRDTDGVWQYVAPSQVEHYRRNLRETVVTVYVVES
jgi:hypothetical protein